MRLRARLLAGLLPPVLLGLGVLALDAYRTSRAALLAQVGSQARALGASQALELGLRLQAGRETAEALAAAVAGAPRLVPADLERALRATLERHPDLLGVAVALDPEATPLGRFAPYVHRSGTGLASRSLAGEDYRYWTWDWYRRPLAQGRGGWGPPYQDRAVQRLMITYGAPVRRDGRTIGVATADLTLDRIAVILEGHGAGSASSAWLVDGHGQVLAGAAEGRSLAPGGRTLADLLPLLREPGASIGELPDPRTGRRSWVLEQPLPALGTGPDWSLVFYYDTGALLRPLRALGWRQLLGALVVGLLVAAAVDRLVASVTRPVRRLADQAHRYATGDFQAALPENRGTGELRELSGAFNAMGRDLQLRIEEIRTATTQRERYRQELAIAAALQQAILPRSFPPFPDLAALVDLHGLMRPATEVGGDFFDFLRLPDGHVAAMVGDVSDKGAAAALLMTQTRLLLRLLGSQGLGPAEVLRRANHVLVQEAPGNMFVTLGYLDYDPGGGGFTAVSAGHPAPILVLPDAPPRELVQPRALPLGAWPGTRYQELRGVLPVGGSLVLYSDGLSEGTDPDGGMFGLERILAALATAPEAGAAGLDQALDQALAAFARGAAAADDLTLLALHRRAAGSAVPDRPRVRLELPADTACLGLAARAVRDAADRAGLAGADRDRLELAVDEVLANAIQHGADGSARCLLLDLEPVPEGLRVVVTDTGAPFPFQAAVQTYDGQPRADQAPGGVGLFLARQAVDELRYEPGTLEGNRMVLVQRRRAPAAG